MATHSSYDVLIYSTGWYNCRTFRTNCSILKLAHPGIMLARALAYLALALSHLLTFSAQTIVTRVCTVSRQSVRDSFYLYADIQ
jgi:hypothetical protein